MKEVVIPTSDAGDDRDYVVMHAIACMNGDWVMPLTDNEEAIYSAQNAHYKETNHTGYWHYKIERSRSRIVHPARGHW